MLRIEGERGALCEWTEEPCDSGVIDNLVRKLERFKDWADHFNLETKIPEIIDWVKRGPHATALSIGAQESKRRRLF